MTTRRPAGLRFQTRDDRSTMPKRSHQPLAVTVLAAVAVLAAGCGATGPGAAGPAQHQAPAAGGSVTPSTSTTTTPRSTVALTLSTLSPAPGATGLAGTTPIIIGTDQAVGSGVRPTITPAVDGTWSTAGDTLRFTPTGAWAPDTVVTVAVPAGLPSAHGAPLVAARSWTFTTGAGTVRRLQQLLAVLHYLPLAWHPSGSTARTGVATADAATAAVYAPPAGSYSWRWAAAPATLKASWVPGQDTAITKGAVMAFESTHGLAVDGVAGHDVWAALLRATTPGANLVDDPNGYTYALASKALPESLTVWHNGAVLATTAANTGIPVSPTVDGTFPVYERLATQIMKGTNPDGSKYADPVAWVAYFNGGDAIHYIGRASYGYPQSLGCVEIPYDVGAHIWPQLTYGTLVSVVG